jgi:branched-chain amino acid transport system permease protein
VTNGRTLFGLPQATTLRSAAVVVRLALIGAMLQNRISVFCAPAATTRWRRRRGVNIPVRWRAFILAAFFAGLAVRLGPFVLAQGPLKETFLVITMLVIGGANSVSGAVIGAFAFTLAYELLRGLEGALNAARSQNPSSADQMAVARSR